MKHTIVILSLTGLFVSSNVRADLFDLIGLKKPNSTNGTNQASSVLATALSQDQIVAGLKEALDKGIKQAVTNLGKTNGFLTNLNVRIPMPEKLATAEKTLRSMGQEKLADDFVATMNHAAEQAVPVAASVFVDAMKQMSINDARNILTGANDAATQFFRRTTQTNLAARFLPIVKKATSENRVTSAYKTLMDKVATYTSVTNNPTVAKVGQFSSLLGKGEALLNNNMSVDVDTYVTDKALDGLFKMIGEEEKKIRQNPAARTTDLLQQVFGALKK